VSVVIGHRGKDGVYFAADYQVTSEDGHRDYETQKIFVRDSYMIGVAGDYKILALMEHFSFSWPISGDKKKFLITQLPLMIKEYLEPYRRDSDKDEGDEYSILIGYEDGMCEITETFEASFFPLFHAIGTGAPYAFGAYHALSFEFDTDIEEILSLAVGAAIRYNAYCGGGVHIEKLPG